MLFGDVVMVRFYLIVGDVDPEPQGLVHSVFHCWSRRQKEWHRVRCKLASSKCWERAKTRPKKPSRPRQMLPTSSYSSLRRKDFLSADLVNEVLYGADEMPDLAHCIERHQPDPGNEVGRWARQFLPPGGSVGPFELLTQLSQGIYHGFRYRRREAKGIQQPVETLRLGHGSAMRIRRADWIVGGRRLGFCRIGQAPALVDRVAQMSQCFRSSATPRATTS